MTKTAAQQFRSDPRVVDARRELLRALSDHQSRLDGVRPPCAELRTGYDETIRQFGRWRGGDLVYPFLGSGFGRGALVELSDGSVKYDFITGIGVHYFGHSHADMVGAAFDAALQDTVMQGNLQQNTESVRLAQTLVELACSRGAALEHCFVTSSGAMANENALKLVFHHKSPAARVLAFRGCFCGRTLALSRVTDKPAYRVGLPRTLPVDYVPFFNPGKPRESTDRAVATLKRHLARHPSRHAAMIFELVLGEGGYYPGNREFFVALMTVLKDAGVAIVVDEIQTFARTPSPFAFQHFGLDEFVDVVTIGKMTQICATLFGAPLKPPPGLVSQTFTAGTSAIFAAQAILDALSGGDFFGPAGRVARLSRRFTERIERIAAAHRRWVRGPFGLGAMVAFTPFDGKPESAKKLLHALYDDGLIAFVAGSKPSRVRFLMPVGALTEGDVDNACDILERSLGRMAAGL